MAGRAATSADPVLAFVRYTANGALDSGFGDGGIQVHDLPGGADYVRDVGIDGAGRIVAGGWSWVAPWPAWTVVRLLSNGELDAAFGSGGVVRTPLGRPGDGDQAEAVELLFDGGILVSGTADWSVQPDFALVRYRPDGQPDPAFGTNGIVITPGVRPDSVRSEGSTGRQASRRRELPRQRPVRLRVPSRPISPDGVLDTTFGGTGVVITDFPGTSISVAESIAVQEQERSSSAAGPNTTTTMDSPWLDTSRVARSTSRSGPVGLRSYDISCDEDPGYAVVVQRLDGGSRERIVQGGASYCYGDYFFAALGVHATGPQPPPPSPPPSGYDITTETGQWMVRGTTDMGNHCNDCTTAISLPFPVTIYGREYTAAAVSSNGNIQFAGSNAGGVNGCLPHPGLGPSFFPYWDDLTTSGFGYGIYKATFFTPPNRVFALEWRAGYFPDFGEANPLRSSTRRRACCARFTAGAPGREPLDRGSSGLRQRPLR